MNEQHYPCLLRNVILGVASSLLLPLSWKPKS